MEPASPSPSVESLLARASWMRSLAREVVGDPWLAEDAVQDALLAALRRPPGPRDEAGLRSWLAAVADRLARRARGRELRRREVEERAARGERTADARAALEQVELQRDLAAALLALPEPLRSAVVLRHVEGLSAEEIARRAGCTPEAARRRVARGIATLRRTLARERRGGREAWLSALLPLARRAAEACRLPAGVSPAVAGALVMSKSTWIAAASLAAVAAALAVRASRAADDPPHPGLAAPERVSAAPVEPPAPERRENEAELAAVAAAAERRAVGAPTPAPSPTPAPVAGRVVDAAGAPVEAAEIRAPEQDEPLAVSGPDGAFVLDALGAAVEELTITVTHADFLSLDARVRPGEHAELVLARRPALEITLRSPEGDVVGGPCEARVFVREAATGELHDVHARFDEDGVLRARGLPVGRLERAEGRARGYAPGEEAFDLELAPDARLTIEIPMSRGIVVAGVVRDADSGAPVPYASVWADTAWFSEDGVQPSTRTDAEGRFVLRGVEARETSSAGVSYVLLGAGADGYAGRTFDAHAFLPGHPIEIELVRAACTISGRVEPLAGGNPSGTFLHVVDSRGNLRFGFTDGDGSFSFEDVPAGDFWLCAAKEEEGGTERAEATLHLVLEGGERREVTVALAPGDASLAGVVVDVNGAPVAGATIAAHRSQRAGNLQYGIDSRDARTDAEGRFEIERLFPGVYHVELVDAGPGACALERSWRLELERGDGATGGRLVAAPCASYSGWVQLDGLDPAALRVRARALAEGDAEPRDLEVESTVAADGSFELPRVPAVEVELVLVRNDVVLGRARVGARGAEGVLLRAEER